MRPAARFFLAVCCLDLVLLLPRTRAFTKTSVFRATAVPQQQHPLQALTERQQQFWEDVESGLDDIERYYREKRGLDIERIRQFGRRYVNEKS